MLTLRLVLRWIGALIAAIFVFTAVFVTVVLVWPHFGAGPVSTIRWSESIATAAAVFTGALVVPRHMAQTAALVVWILALMPPVWFLIKEVLLGQFEITALWEFSDTFLGGFPVYLAIRSSGFATFRRRATN
jgi:hypothetical protein